MEKKSNWPLHLVAGLFLAVLIVIVFWQPASRGLCPAEKLLELTASQNCFDFLLNRYQTLLTGTFTLVAAAVAFVAVSAQIRHTEKLATRDGRHSARAMTEILRYCHDRLSVQYGKRLSNTDRWNAKFVLDGCVMIIDVVIRNVDAIRDRLFSDDLVDVLNSCNDLLFFKEFLQEDKKDVPYEKFFKDLIYVEKEIENVLNTLIAALEMNASRRDQ